MAKEIFSVISHLHATHYPVATELEVLLSSLHQVIGSNITFEDLENRYSSE